VREGDRVSIPRGSLVETYELALDSMEQTFVLAARPAGDLRVVVDVESELAASETEHGLELAGEHGRVRYGRASGKDANGALVPLSTHFETGKVVIDVPESVLASARFPFTIDPIVSTFVIDDTTFDDLAPDVAYDFATNRWAVVYEEVFSATDGDCYIQLLNSSGVGISADYIDFTGEDWRAPKIANLRSAGQFLVVSSVGGVAATFTRVIRGRTCNASNNALGTLFNISGTESGDKLNPDSAAIRPGSPDRSTASCGSVSGAPSTATSTTSS
jgi:hypothetical protein